MPTQPGTYVIFRLDEELIQNCILDIGKAGLRDGKGQKEQKGLQGRIADTCPHSASERMARDVKSGALPDALQIVWFTTETQAEAEALKAGLINLFKREFGHNPVYNRRNARSASPEQYVDYYDTLKPHLGHSSSLTLQKA
ncbi:hypothetical protein [Spirosoma endbachense]|uniref:Uncharacterized protein n=1 Tax=Spirosoma endbachense TaxID=2666025 RepID=A0A6P1VZZ4_9BACT|nr:hypothetical protein [Spirosoma endbachense]QHV97299.1 hypothetical protein GJR95_20820 [Spirosoma endbachense]